MPVAIGIFLFACLVFMLLAVSMLCTDFIEKWRAKAQKHTRDNCKEYPVTISQWTGGAYGCKQCIIEDELERIQAESESKSSN